ncbi:MAG: hypothetical protein FJ088_08530, partial [Deltaproteobacteria bacterium]|nr:hypothetical protein [Deltaproteobacteria bacterium]
MFGREGRHMMRRQILKQRSVAIKDAAIVMPGPALCQFGPGGDYVQVWPAGSERLPEAVGEVEFSVPANKTAPLVSLGPCGIQWEGRQRQEERPRSPWRGLVAAIRRLAGGEDPAEVVCQQAAPLEQVAMAVGPGLRIVTDRGYALVAGENRETDYGECDAEATGDPEIHPG